MLTVLLFLPALGAAFVALLPRAREQDARWLALAVSGATLLLAAVVFLAHESGEPGYQFVDRFEWIRAAGAGFSVQYALGVDGLSAPMVLLNGLLSVVAVLVSFRVTDRPRAYFAWLLLLETAVMGVFLSLDLLQFFVFWELELLPMYLLISGWGTGRREYSATKFVLYTLAGSAFMLVGFLVLGLAAGSFEIEVLARDPVRDAAIPLSLVFWAVMAAFLVKLPVVPLHTWLPDAHTDAPTAVSVILAGVLLKMGGYGILRIALPLLPGQAQEYSALLAALAGLSVLYGAVITLQQRDLKRLVAYSSVSHMGYVLLGVSALGTTALAGAALQMFTHGLITGLLFVTVGLIYDRTHTREIAELRGLMHRLPLIGAVTVVAGLASLGLPGLAGFVAEFTTFVGAIQAQPAATVAGVAGIVLAAGYILWTVERVFTGPPDPRWSDLADATAWWERTAMGSLVAVIVWVGIFPRPLTDVIRHGVEPVAALLGAA